jgi:hypothetical protein
VILGKGFGPKREFSGPEQGLKRFWVAVALKLKGRKTGISDERDAVAAMVMPIPI